LINVFNRLEKINVMLVDPHVHVYSPCAKWTFKQLIREADIKELDVIIITDHDRISKVPIEIHGNVKIFVGVEISSKDGHVLAYGVSEEIPPLSTQEVMEKIHEQGGIAIAAHPFRNFEREGLQSSPCSIKEGIFDVHFDGIETMNGLNTARENELARKNAEILNLSKLGGSDAHQEGQLGNALTITKNEINVLDDFIAAVRKKLVKPRQLSGVKFT